VCVCALMCVCGLVEVYGIHCHHPHTHSLHCTLQCSGDEYDRLMLERVELTKLKKAVNAVNAAIAVMLVDLTDTKRADARDKAVEDLKGFYTTFPGNKQCVLVHVETVCFWECVCVCV
jgi:hypothetical protein